MEKAAARKAAAVDQIARIVKGEYLEVGTQDFDAILTEAGITERFMRRCRQIAELSEVGAFEELLQEIHERHERSERAALRAVCRRHGLS
jgi:hypothetical protein